MTTLNVDQSAWGVIRVTGDDRVRFLQGMCTADVTKLTAPGDWLRGSVLNVKGRVVSIIEVLHQGDHLLVLCEPELAEPTLALFQKHAIADDVEFALERRPLHRVWGPPAEAWAAPPLLGPAPEPVATPEQVEVRRVEAGIPRWGVDVTGDHFPFESRLAEHIDYDKGCYLGQEPIARVHARGNPNQHMLGLRILEGAGPVARGAIVVHPERDRAGEVTSSVVSPDFGPIALAYVHRTVATPGAEVSVEGRRARLVALPFTA